MAIGPRRTLPLAAVAPRLAEVRRQLGGPATHTGLEGRCVSLTGPLGEPLVGVVLHETSAEVDVWLTGSSVRRVRADRAFTVHGEAEEPLRECSADVQLYASLVNGQRVLFEDGRGATLEGILVEKCRFGAIVARDDGSVMAIGFRRLWPAQGTRGAS